MRRKAPPPALTQELVRADWTAVPHGKKGEELAALMARTGLSRSTLYARRIQVMPVPARKERADKGRTALPREEALAISTLLMESHRRNGKRLMSIGLAVSTARANGLAKAEAVDADGVIRPLSDSAVSNALRLYGLHPKQLLRPAPAVELRSLHPNHVWQLDASMCVLYYLETDGPRMQGLQVMERGEFYKNKPKNLKRIENDRVWSYEITDHNTGAIYLFYVLGAESSRNAAEAFISAIQQREGEPFHGVPFLLYTDAGVGGALFENLLRRLQVNHLQHKPGNARATGSVEKARDIIETSFESALRFQNVRDLEHLQILARRWCAWFNGTQVHSRHGHTRWGLWQTIKQEHLRLAPPEAVCRELMTHAPERRRVSNNLTVSFLGHGEFCLRQLPDVIVGEWVEVTYSPYDIAPDGQLRAACIVERDEQGHEQLRRIPLVERGADGFRLDANVIGEDWTRPPETVADRNRKAVELLAMQADTLEEARAKRKRKHLPFGGQVDPLKRMDADKAPHWMKRRGTALTPTATVDAAPVPERVLNHFEAAREIVNRGMQLNPELNQLIATWHPDGVPEWQIDNLMTRLQRHVAVTVQEEIRASTITVAEVAMTLRARLREAYQPTIWGELVQQFPDGVPAYMLDALAARYAQQPEASDDGQARAAGGM
jgi:hypothetical protein